MVESPLCWGDSISWFSRPLCGPPVRAGAALLDLRADNGEAVSTRRGGALGRHPDGTWGARRLFT
jgi:hypothetical protein